MGFVLWIPGCDWLEKISWSRHLPQALQTFFLTQSLERVFHHCTLFYSRPRSCIFYHEGYCGKWSPAVIHAEEYGAVGCIEGWGHFQPQEQHSWPTSPLYAAPLGPVPVSQPPRPLESVRRAHWALTVGVSPTLAGGCGAVWFGQQACTWGHIDLSGKLLCSSNWTGKRCFIISSASVRPINSAIPVHFGSWIPKMLVFPLAISFLTFPICLDSWTWHSRFLCHIVLYSIGLYFHHQSHPQLGVVFALALSLNSFWSYFSSYLQ